MSHREKSLEEILKELNVEDKKENSITEEKESGIEEFEGSVVKRIAKALRLLDGIVDTGKLADIVIKYVKIDELVKEIEKIDQDLAYLLKLVLEKSNM